MNLVLALLLASSAVDSCPLAQRVRLDLDAWRAGLLKPGPAARRKASLAKLDLKLPEPCKNVAAGVAAVDLFEAPLTSTAGEDVIVQVRIQECGAASNDGSAFLLQVLRPIGEDRWCKLGTELSDSESAARDRERRLAQPGVEGEADLSYNGEDPIDESAPGDGIQAFELFELLQPGRQIIAVEDVSRAAGGETTEVLEYWVAEAASLRRIFSVQTSALSHISMPHWGDVLDTTINTVTRVGEPPKKLLVVHSENCGDHGCCNETEHQLWELVDGTYMKTRVATPTWEF